MIVAYSAYPMEKVAALRFEMQREHELHIGQLVHVGHGHELPDAKAVTDGRHAAIHKAHHIVDG